MIPELLGRLVGFCVKLGGRLWHQYAGALRVSVVVALWVVAAPMVIQYWTDHIRVPQIPVTAIVALVAATLFLLVCGSFLYLLVILLVNLPMSLRASLPAQAPSPFHVPGLSPKKPAATGGSFIATDDEFLYEQENLDILKKKGILHETDVSELASELGHQELLRRRGKTVGQ